MDQGTHTEPLIGQIATVGTQLNDRLADLNSRVGVKRHIQQELEKARTELAAAQAELDVTEKANLVLQTVIETQRKELSEKVERIASYGLSVVFDEAYQLHLNLVSARNQMSAEFYVSNESMGNYPTRLIDARGGGLVSVTSFLMKQIMLLSSRPPLRRIMFLDEPLVMVSNEYKENLCCFIRELAEKTEIQFVIVTHDSDLMELGDVRYRFKLVSGQTMVECIDD